MKMLFVITDSYRDCEKAVKFLVDLKEKVKGEFEVLAVLEDVYRLEKSGVSLGFPVPPDVKEESMRRVKKAFIANWEKFSKEEVPHINFAVGPLYEEVKKFINGKNFDLILWACYPTAYLCKVIDDLNISSLIIK